MIHNSLHLLSNFKRKATHLLLAFTSGKGGECGTLNVANREVWLEKTLANIPAGSRILDAGAGELQYKRFCAHLNYVSQDFAQYDGQGDGVGFQTRSWNQSQLDIVCDITNIPERDVSFDAVMCIEVLEHLPNPVAALHELRRLLKPGGTLIITAPFCSFTHFSPHFFYTGYSRYFYEYWLGELGFEIVEMQFNGNYFDWVAQALRWLPGIAMDYSGMAATFLEKNCINIVLGLLNRLSQNNAGSEQLLTYGMHIRARKR
jgi:SAM-dependent methyltransferase